MFLRRKRCGRVKGRGCADGRPHRAFIPSEDATSPAVSIQAVFLTCLIDTHEGRDVTTVDVPGAFIQADMDDLVYLRLTRVGLWLLSSRETAIVVSGCGCFVLVIGSVDYTVPFANCQ
jgi:hypothetical protein